MIGENPTSRSRECVGRVNGGCMRLNGRGVGVFLGITLLILLGCSSFFSFSWHTEKKVGQATPGVHPRGKRPGAASGKTMVQISRLDLKSPAALPTFMKKLRRHRVDVICFRVFQNRGDAFFRVLPIKAREGVYFRTDRAPLVSNLLPLVCREAHRYGIEVYAWMSTLSANFLRCETAARLSRYDLSTKEVAQTRRLNPFDSRVRQCLYDLFSDLAGNELDGILIQDDLILRYNEGVGPLAAREYRDDMGGDSLNPARFYRVANDARGHGHLAGYRPAFWRWTRWKSRRLALVVRRLIRAVKRTQPTVRVALDVPYELLLAPRNALAWYSVDLPTLEEIARPDQYMVMSYQQQMAGELKKPVSAVQGLIEDMVKRAMGEISNPRRWVFKIQTIDWTSRRPIPPKTIREV